jgi:poly-gamma-glutamate synthesis protein (capsule biosynthesis protein)
VNYKNILLILSGILITAGCIQSPKKQLRIAFAGDTMLGRLVNEVINQRGYAYPWGNILPLLQKADFRMVNLETTFTKSEKRVPKVFNYKADPKNIHALMKANINVVSLANNHSKDFGNEGLLDTIKTLDNANILHVGAGHNIEQAQLPVILEDSGIKIGIIGATDNEPTWHATETTPGINYFSVDNLTDLLKQIIQLKKQVDLLIISLHWGPNMRQQPTQKYIDAAHLMIDAGADIIHGHSAHIFQGVEIYKNKLIMYDTGDFVDDYRIDPYLRNDRALLFFVTLDKSGVKRIELTPLLINTMQVNVAEGADKKKIVEKMKCLSAELGTTISDDGSITIL